MNFNVKEDFWLFENDLREYHASREGRAVINSLQYDDFGEVISTSELSKALDVYFNARNGAGLTFDDDAARDRGRAMDEYFAKLYSELN